MEPLWEQVAFGDHCIHGTAVGTPGGADLLCGMCEMGMTHLTPVTVAYERLRAIKDNVVVSTTAWKRTSANAESHVQALGDSAFLVTEVRTEPGFDWFDPSEQDFDHAVDCPSCV